MHVGRQISELLVGLFDGDPGVPATIDQVLLQHEREQRAEDVAAVGGIEGVADVLSGVLRRR